MVSVQVINKSKNPLPKYESDGAAGLDLRADIEGEFVLKAHSRVLIPTGLYIELPFGYEAQVRSRSGLAVKKGVIVLNAPGTIDSDYRGNIGVPLFNTSDEDYVITPGERIAQLVINKVEQLVWMEVEELDQTDRGEGGFGHSGKN